MIFSSDIEWQEALEFRPGRRVELKRQPGVFDAIADYDPMMVPPISLVNDPMPRYPEELRLIHQSVSGISHLNRQHPCPARYPTCQLRNDLQSVVSTSVTEALDHRVSPTEPVTR